MKFGTAGEDGWASVSVPVSRLTAVALDLANVSAGILRRLHLGENESVDAKSGFFAESNAAPRIRYS